MQRQRKQHRRRLLPPRQRLFRPEGDIGSTPARQVIPGRSVGISVPRRIRKPVG